MKYGIYLAGEVMVTHDDYFEACSEAQQLTRDTGVVHGVMPIEEEMNRAKVIKLIAKVIFDASEQRNDNSWMYEPGNSLDKLCEELNVSEEEIRDKILIMNGPDPVAMSKTEEGTYKRTLVEMHYPWDMIEDWSEEKCESEIESIDSSDVI
ncbi:hypothetical protein AWW71_27290 [Bacillus cereus]|uniref:hypothetical protein n=1 Tax=Bacillus cereus TaxID=1396 RepID=UPI0007622E85|nr:hypothetical protein [Bacillus cereus]KWU69131.1 hypothetical protein AWW71_27290 [Bacillus cereus]